MHNHGIMFDWNDLRYFLAVARSGSTLAASKSLRVSQATVSRRVTVLEEALGTGLFVRSASGYTLTTRGCALLTLAEDVESAVRAFEQGAKTENRRLSGRVLLTTVDFAATRWIIPALARLRETHPDILVEIVTTDRVLDVSRGEADLGVRFGPKPTQESLVVRHLVDLEECFYANQELVAKFGMPCCYSDLANFPLVDYHDDRLGEIASWVAQNVPNAKVVQRVTALSSIVAGVRAGLGAALLPTVMGDSMRGLVRLFAPIPPRSRCWLVTTDAARRQPHVRAVIDVVADEIVRMTRPPQLSAVA